MMRTKLFLIAALLTAGFSSCTREYYCKCVVKYTGRPGLPDSSNNEYPVRDTKSAAKETCEGNSFTITSDSVTTTETCTIY